MMLYVFAQILAWKELLPSCRYDQRQFTFSQLQTKFLRTFLTSTSNPWSSSLHAFEHTLDGVQDLKSAGFHAGAPEVLMGLTITLSCCLELPIFHYMGSILKVVGVQAMLHWVMLFFLASLLFLCLSYTKIRDVICIWMSSQLLLRQGKETTRSISIVCFTAFKPSNRLLGRYMVSVISSQL